jgi:hypothetical protein
VSKERSFVIPAFAWTLMGRFARTLSKIPTPTFGGWAMIVILALTGTVGGCARLTSPTGSPTLTSLPTSTFKPSAGMTPTWTLTAEPAATPDVRTPGPNTVQVTLSVAPDSSEAGFAVRNARGDLVFETYWPLVRKYVIYLPPGEYTWSASAPVPTPPLGCFIVEEYYGYSRDGRFTAVKEKIDIEVRLGEVISYCTPTPGTP